MAGNQAGTWIPSGRPRVLIRAPTILPSALKKRCLLNKLSRTCQNTCVSFDLKLVRLFSRKC